MTQFYDATVGGLTVEECDRIALESAGRVYSTGYSFAMPKGGDVNEEYAAKVINTRGMGNHGTIVLVGKTRRARRLLREGKKRWLMQQGVSERIARVAVSMPYGMEVEVAKLAEEIMPVVQHGFWYRGGSNREFNEWFGVDSALSYPRKIAALEIARKAAA